MREGGLSAAIKKPIHTRPFSFQVITEEKSRRTAEYAFAHCRVNNRPKVHVIHKANIMKLTDGE